MLRSLLKKLFGASDEAIAAPIEAAETGALPGTAIIESPAPNEADAPESAADAAPAVDPHAWWMPRGVPVIVAPSASASLRPIDTDLYSELTKALDEPNIELPQLPDVAQRVLRLLEKQDVNFAEAARVAERDPVLTAEILRVVNSASFRAIRQVQRLNQAFPRLGVRRLRAILVSATMKSIMIAPGGGSKTVGTQLWRGASAAAVVAAETAPRVGIPEDEAYLSGLLHDIGMMVLLRVLHDYQTKTGKKITRPIYAALAERWHEHLGLRLADSWHLPDPLPELIANHHKIPAEGDPLAKPRLLLAFSDVVCAMLEYTPYIPYDFFNHPAVARLGINDNADTREFLNSLPMTIEKRLAWS